MLYSEQHGNWQSIYNMFLANSYFFLSVI